MLSSNFARGKENCTTYWWFTGVNGGIFTPGPFQIIICLCYCENDVITNIPMVDLLKKTWSIPRSSNFPWRQGSLTFIGLWRSSTDVECMLPLQRLYLPVSLRYSKTIQFHSVCLINNDLTFALNGCTVFQAPHGAMMIMQKMIVVCFTHKLDARMGYCWD